MTAAIRIDHLRATNPDAVTLASTCALAARVEPALLRQLRLLLPHASAAAEADLWFSDLVAGRDSLAMALDPMVAELLRAELRRPDRIALRESAATTIAAAHADAHWSVRLEDRVHYLDVTRPPDADAEIDDLLVAALGHLTDDRQNSRGIARWLFGAIGRLPRMAATRTSGRASAAAAMLHLDSQAPAPALLDAGESEAWLPWVAQALPTVPVPVRLLDGAVVLGGERKGLMITAPDTDPLVLEVRWAGGDRLVRFRGNEPIQVETGTSTVTLTTLAGSTYELLPEDEPEPAGLNFDHIKANLRPCLGREKELAQLLASRSPLTAITGRPGSGTSTVLVAATDRLRASGTAVVEHFFAADVDQVTIDRSCLAQLDSWYPDKLHPDIRRLEDGLRELARQGLFVGRPLVIAFDDVDTPVALSTPPIGVTYLTTSQVFEHAAKQTRTIALTSDRETCVAMIERERRGLELAFVGPLEVDTIVNLADDLPRDLATIIRWAIRRPAGSVTTDTIPAAITTRWPKARADLEDRFGHKRTAELLDMLRAAHRRNTWQDCLYARVARDIWVAFWNQCLDLHIVLDTKPTELVRLAEPESARLLRHPHNIGDFILGMDGEVSIWTAGPTRFAAAVHHALAYGDRGSARARCTDLTALRRSYAECRADLVTDLAAVAQDDDLVVLHEVVDKIDVSPTAFASVLYDRLAERSALHIVPDLIGEAPVRPPLRVRAVHGEQNLRAGTAIETGPGPVHALALMMETPISLPSAADDPVLITDTGLTTFEGEELISGWSGVLGATRGPQGGFALWTADRIWTDATLDTIELDEPVDHVTRLYNTVVIAGMDGTVTIRLLPDTNLPVRHIPGHGARVTAVNGYGGFAGTVVIGSEDGTIATVTGRQRVHRGAVRCIGMTRSGRVSGGDDGLLHWQTRGAPQRHQCDSPITCVDVRDDDTVVFGGADGSVRTWHPHSGETTLLTQHREPVRGVTATRDGVVSWAGSVSFRPTDEAAITMTGFPDGVRDLVVTNRTYTMLCGDGSVRRQPRPNLRATTGAPARTCLAVSNGTVYAGVDWDLVQVTTDEIVAVTDQNSSPFTRAVPLAGGVLATGAISMAIDPVGNISTRQFIDGTDFVATNGSDLLVTAAGHRVRLWATDSVLLATADNTFRQPVWQADVPANVTSLALTADNQVIAGLADGTTVLGTDLSRCYGGDGTPVTAVAALPDGSVITGTASGVIRRWPADPAHGPTVLAHRAGAIAALAVTDTWLLSAGADGTLLLWAVDQFHLVHETTIGTPIVAMAAEDDLVAARGEDGRLWLLDLDPMPDRITPTPLSISPSAISFDGRLRVAVDSGRHELTGIRVWVDGVPVPLTCADPWPAVRPDGSLLVPVRLTAERPIYFESPEPLHHGQVDLDLAAPAAIGEPAIVLHTR